MAIVDKIAERLYSEVRMELSWTDITSTVGGASNEAKGEILEAIRAGNARNFSRKFIELIEGRVREKALVEAQGYVDASTVPLNKLGRLI